MSNKTKDTPNRGQMPPPPAGKLAPPDDPPTPADVQDHEQHPSMAAPMEHGEEAYTKAPFGAEGKPDPVPRNDPDAPGYGEAAPEPGSRQFQGMPVDDSGPDSSPKTDGRSTLGKVVDAVTGLFQNTPTHVQTGAPQPDSTRRVKSPSAGIEVVANRPGIIYQVRRNIGDKFYISSPDELGSWMTLADPQMEASRQRNYKASKQAGK